jgi:CheY-like chemotaxis protein
MNKKGPIIIIDDDADDQDLVREMFSEMCLPNEICIFNDGESALAYLAGPEVSPFIIISDIKMPKMDGFELKDRLSQMSQKLKATPFLFFTNGGTPHSLNTAYNLSVQGVFQKPVRYHEWKQTMQNIIQYWNSCLSPAG